MNMPAKIEYIKNPKNRELPVAELDHFAKELDVAEIKEFEALLANDPDFKEEVKAHAYARISIQQEGNKLLKEKLNQMGQKIQQEKGKRRIVYFRAIAAVFLVLISSILLIKYISDPEYLDGKARKPLYERELEAPGPPGLRGSTYNLSWNQGVSDYDKGDYQAAINSWQTLSKDTIDSELWFYLGACNIMLEEVDSAHFYLNKVEPASFYYYQAKWYQAILYIKAGNQEAARPLLEILKSESRKYGSFAEDILETLN